MADKVADFRRWRQLADERGELVAACETAERCVHDAPAAAGRAAVQRAISATLRRLTGGRIRVRLVPDQGPTCYSIEGRTWAFQVEGRGRRALARNLRAVVPDYGRRRRRRRLHHA